MFINNQKLKKANELLDNVLGYSLDKYQRIAILNNDLRCLIIAGAGSGKTLTIIGKIMYLVKILNIKEEDILTISFTAETVKSLIEKLKSINFLNVDVMTFHKLGLNIIRTFNKSIKISNENILKYSVYEYLENLIFQDFYSFNQMCKYLKIYGPYKLKIKKYKRIYQTQKNQISTLFIRFISLYKSNNYSNFNLKKLSKKEKSFFYIALKILKIYENENLANNSIDFNDMLNKASNYVLKFGIKKNYKYIIIDEFQDTSFSRYNLIKSIVDKLNCHLICVGDDYQAIYGFTGCNLDIFINFEKYFGSYKTYYIPMTYRNSQELINVAGNFISQNKMQIKKELKSLKKIDKPIVIVFYKNIKNDFNKLLDKVAKKYNDILILGRNNNDIFDVIDKENKFCKFNLQYNGKNIRYLTIHKSKGLESEVVIIINLTNSILGFPSKVKDNKILSLVLNNKEDILNEERRLFYVALTRSKTKVFLFVPYKNYSIFIKELLKDYLKYIEVIKF